jgi:hypothetical protein
MIVRPSSNFSLSRNDTPSKTPSQPQIHRIACGLEFVAEGGKKRLDHKIKGPGVADGIGKGWEKNDCI